MNLMQGRFFTGPRIVVSLVSVLITISVVFLFGSLADSIFGSEVSIVFTLGSRLV
jgi:hypothetical protein